MESLLKSQVDIVIVTYNSALVIEALLDSIPDATDDVRSSVIVVDNGSIDSTREILLKRSDCKVIVSHNGGYAAGINRGVREGSNSDAILVLNPDAKLHKGSIRHMLNALAVPGTGIVAPRIVSESGETQLSLCRDFTLLRALGLTRFKSSAFSEYVQEPEAYEKPHAVEWACGAALMMSRPCFDILDGWDESFFLYSEETDLALRARDLGISVRYEPQAVVMHIGGGSGRSGKTYAMLAINRVRLYGRRHNRIATWCFFWLMVAKELSWAARGHGERRFSASALLRPSLRPVELKSSSSLLPHW